MNLSQDLKTELLPKLRARYARRHRDGKSRLLAPARAQQPLRGRCGTKPGTLLRTEIPIRTAWDVSRPGYLEADSVALRGSLAGDFIRSLTCTDIVSQWTEGRAMWNKGAAGVVAATRTVEAELPLYCWGLTVTTAASSWVLAARCWMFQSSFPFPSANLRAPLRLSVYPV